MEKGIDIEPNEMVVMIELTGNGDYYEVERRIHLSLRTGA